MKEGVEGEKMNEEEAAAVAAPWKMKEKTGWMEEQP